MANRHEIKFMGVVMVEQHPNVMHQVAYDAYTGYGRAQILRVPDPRPHYRGEKVFDMTLDGAIIGRAQRPGAAAKAGEKWLMKVCAKHLAVMRERASQAERPG